jgi:hypothetical protein
VAEKQWLRLRAAVNCPLRRGAWYPVDAVTPLEAVVTVDGKPVTLPLASVELRTTQPRAWSIVRPADGSPRRPESLQSGYIVCPNCRNRAVLPFARVFKVRCSACKELLEIAWDEEYFEKG